MTSWLVVVNESAGGGRSAVATATEALHASGVDYELIRPATRQQMSAAINDAVAAGRRRYVAVGGDGTVNALVNDLLQHRWDHPPVVGVLPGGTGCDLIRTFGIPQHMAAAASHLTGDAQYLIDIATVHGEWGTRHFVNVGEVGVAAAAVQWADRLPRRMGRIRYPIGLALALPRFQRVEVAVEGGRRPFVGEALAVIFANGQFFGGGFNVAPKATLVDGLLDVQIVTANKRRAGSLVPRIYRGMHLTDPDIRRFVASAIHIETARPWPVEVDGEYVGNTPIDVSVAPGRIALKI